MPPDAPDKLPTTSTSVAFVTLVTTDSYAPGALALAYALRARSPRPGGFDLVALATPSTLSPSTQHSLRAAFTVVIGVEPLNLSSLAAVAASTRSESLAAQEEQNLIALDRPDLATGTPLTKIHVWRLATYRQVVYLDADILPLRSLDHLLTLPLNGIVAAAPDAGWPDTFNSGLLVLTPSEDTFTSIAQYALNHPSWDGADQGLLNDYVASRGTWDRLSFLYNVTPHGGYMYPPAWARFSHEAYAVHFIGAHKPWNELPPVRPSGVVVAAPLPNPPAGDFSSLAYAWWRTYVAARPSPDPLGLTPTSLSYETPLDNYLSLALPGKTSLLPEHITQPPFEANTPKAEFNDKHKVGHAPMGPPLTYRPQAPSNLSHRYHNAWDNFGRDRAQATARAHRHAEQEAQHLAKQRAVLEHLAQTQGCDNWGSYLPSTSSDAGTSMSVELPKLADPLAGPVPDSPSRPTRYFPEDQMETEKHVPQAVGSTEDRGGIPQKVKYTNAWDRIPSIAALGGQRKVDSGKGSSLRTAIRQRVKEANRTDAQERAWAHAHATGPPTRDSSSPTSLSSFASLPPAEDKSWSGHP